MLGNCLTVYVDINIVGVNVKGWIGFFRYHSARSRLLSPLDRRSRWLSLTAKGNALLASAMPVWEQTHRDVESLLKDGDPDRLRSGLLALS
jgi:hypothetical protein